MPGEEILEVVLVDARLRDGVAIVGEEHAVGVGLHPPVRAACRQDPNRAAAPRLGQEIRRVGLHIYYIQTMAAFRKNRSAWWKTRFEIRLADYPTNDIFLLSAISVKPVYPVSHNSCFSLSRLGHDLDTNAG